MGSKELSFNNFLITVENRKDDCMKAEEILKIIKELENGERWKLLELMYDEYYNTRRETEKSLGERLRNLERDIEYLSKKVGLHEMYFNRIHKENTNVINHSRQIFDDDY
jgi:hypothetical protein